MFMFLLAGALFARADDKTVTLPELIQDAQQWAQDNLDTNVLNALPKPIFYSKCRKSGCLTREAMARK
jgi:hypothetical protein